MAQITFDDILLVCDMDRTLLNSQSKVSFENLSAIRNFTKRGGRFTVATGRMSQAVRPYINELPVNAPAILYNGAMIYDFKANKPVWQKYLEEDVKQALELIYREFPGAGIEIFNSEKIFVVRRNIETDKHILREGLNPVECSLSDVPFPWLKVLIAWDNEGLKKIKDSIGTKELSFRTVFSEPQFLEIVHSTASKGDALDKLVEMLGFSRNKVISIGDNLNDIELIETAGVGIAVGNAHQDLKEIADFCCCCHDDHAAAEVIRWIEEGKISL